jgi:hypothetical protein
LAFFALFYPLGHQHLNCIYFWGSAFSPNRPHLSDSEFSYLTVHTKDNYFQWKTSLLQCVQYVVYYS